MPPFMGIESNLFDFFLILHGYLRGVQRSQYKLLKKTPVAYYVITIGHNATNVFH